MAKAKGNARAGGKSKAAGTAKGGGRASLKGGAKGGAKANAGMTCRSGSGKSGTQGAAAGRGGATRGAARGAGSAAGRGSGRAAGKGAGKGAGLRVTGKGTIGKSGEGLDGGVARREAGDPRAIGTRPTATSRPSPRKARTQLPGEKAISDTDRTFEVEPERPAPGEQEPMPDIAVDRRRHIVGTDDPGADAS
jgi:hypothetical protein